MIREEKCVDLLVNMVKHESISGNEEAVAKYIKGKLEEFGYDEAIIDKNGSVIGIINGNRPGKTILFDGHIDTVGIPDIDMWTKQPFGGEIEDGKIYGRGSSDMKGGVAAMICGAIDFADDTKRNFAGKICVSCSVHEECFEGISSEEIVKIVNPDLVVICEPTDGKLMIGQLGRAEIVIEATGKSCHSSNPAEGINAVYHMNSIIDELRKIPKNTHPQLGTGILELVDISSYPFPSASVVPATCQATFDRRILVGETEESVLNEINEALERVKKNIPNLKATAKYVMGKERCYTGNVIEAKRYYPGWLSSEKSEMVKKALIGIKKAGKETTVSTMHYCSNGSGFCGVMGIEGIGYGPSRVELAHTPDEYIKISDLLDTANTYRYMLAEWTK